MNPLITPTSPIPPPRPPLKKYRFQVWVFEIAHGTVQFGCRMLMMETCAGQIETDSWEEAGRWLDKAISVDGQQVSRVVNLGSMRSTSAFYDYIGNEHKAGRHDHPTYPLPHPTAATAFPDVG